MRQKILLVLFLLSIFRGTVLALDLSFHEITAQHARQIRVDNARTNLSDSVSMLTNGLSTFSGRSSLLYGGVSLFAVMMIVFVLRTARDSEIKTLNSELKDLAARLSEADSAKIQAENRLKQELKKKQELLEEKDSLVDELEDSLRRIHALTTQLRETQGLSKACGTELKTRGSQVNTVTG